MLGWWRKKKDAETAVAVQEGIAQRYGAFRDLLSLNNDCLELLASIQEDLQYTPPKLKLFEGRIRDVFDKTTAIVSTLEHLSGYDYEALRKAIDTQRNEVLRYLVTAEEGVTPRLSAWLTEVDLGSIAEVGAKAAALGEVKNELRLPVPEGFVITAEAYRHFFGIPRWSEIRDATRGVDLNDLQALKNISDRLSELVMECMLPRAIRIAITERALSLQSRGEGLVVRSSAAGEGGERTFAGQFLSLINVPVDGLVDAYRKVVAGRFSERALFYRLSAGLPEVENPMAVLFLQLVKARTAGVLYTRDPKDPKSDTVWITATRGLALDIASGSEPADLFVVGRKPPHRIVDQNIVSKDVMIIAPEGGGLLHQSTPAEEREVPCLNYEELPLLAKWGIRIEEHFGVPQDIEWVQDDQGQFWIVQARPLALIGSQARTSVPRIKGEPLVAGGLTVCPGRVSGPAYLVSDLRALRDTPEGAILCLRKASPEIVMVFPRISGVVAELGSVAGHVATLLREAKIPSVFQMKGLFERLKAGEDVSLDAVHPKIYPGNLWGRRAVEATPEYFPEGTSSEDPLRLRVLELHLLSPEDHNFRPGGCKSAHDVLRFCHEKAIESMFAINDSAIEADLHSSKRLMTPVPVNIYVLDLGGGLALKNPASPEVDPSEIVSRPFQALWRGLSHPKVSWQRDIPASLSDVASVLTNWMKSQSGAPRALGNRSYLLVADEYMNLNSRLAYHFTLVDACISDIPSHNYISFRFAGGGATRYRRNLRACFIEACLAHYGFLVHRRGDLLNAWFKKAPSEETEPKLDILGRLMASASQLDMYMTDSETMKWYVRQFLEGNYTFQREEAIAKPKR